MAFLKNVWERWDGRGCNFVVPYIYSIGGRSEEGPSLGTFLMFWALRCILIFFIGDFLHWQLGPLQMEAWPGGCRNSVSSDWTYAAVFRVWNVCLHPKNALGFGGCVLFQFFWSPCGTMLARVIVVEYANCDRHNWTIVPRIDQCLTRVGFSGIWGIGRVEELWSALSSW